ncbi:22148_t:CDS:2, partial [Dentiscutata erythropus]
MKKNQSTENTRLILSWEKEIVASLSIIQNHTEQKTTPVQIKNMKFTQEKSLSGKVEDNTSFLKPYRDTIQSEKVLIKNNPLFNQQKISTQFQLISKFLNIKNLPSKIERGLIIFVIILNLIQLEKYPVYGYWECRKCNNGHRWIEKCGFLQKPSENSKIKPIIEIICHLQWNKYYRVFGGWECQNCKEKVWKSAYTYISLRKFIEGRDLNEGDYIMQECKRCKDNNDKCIVTSYEPLKQGEDYNIHKRHLCEKCKS